MASTIRFVRQFMAPAPGAVTAEETTYRRGDQQLPATLYRPTGRRGEKPLPGWVTLHGLTYKGRRHPSLVRFARAQAAAGAVVLVPELPEWMALDVAPERTVETVKAAVLELDSRGVTEPGRIGVAGFSFGATQSLIAACDPALDGHLAGVTAWGGYYDLHHVARFMFVGDHSLDGRDYHLEPDPYGRWILCGNYLTLVPGMEEMAPAAGALHALAREAGRLGVMSWSAELDPIKAELAAPLAPDQRAVFDLLAPPADAAWTPEDRERVERLSQSLADAVLEHEPLLNPRPYLPRVPVPVVLAHGRDDRLMPFTEMIRLERDLPPDQLRHTAITALFAHSFGEKRLPTPGVIADAARFYRLLGRMVKLV